MNAFLFAFGGVALLCIVIGWHLSDVPAKPKQKQCDIYDQAARYLIEAANEEWKERQL